MKNLKNYNKYIFISTFTRNIIDIYSIIYLYQKGISINDIIATYALIYFLGAIISSISLKLGSLYGYKYVLILSSIFTSMSFYILRSSMNLYLIAIFLSLSMFTYHPIKHYYGLNLLKQKKQIANTLILSYLATLISSYLAIKEINLFILIIISIIGILPACFLEREKNSPIIYPNHLSKEKLSFFILDQFKIIFLLLEPLYLYVLSSNLSYVGIFNIILTISSIIYLHIITNKIDLAKNYKYLNLFFCIVLFLKLNLKNKIFLLILAFFEGMGIKTNELVSTMNLYNTDNLNVGYLITSEKIFCYIRAILLSIIFLLRIDLLTSLYFLLLGIILLSFTYRENFTRK